MAKFIFLLSGTVEKGEAEPPLCAQVSNRRASVGSVENSRKSNKHTPTRFFVYVHDIDGFKHCVQLYSGQTSSVIAADQLGFDVTPVVGSRTLCTSFHWKFPFRLRFIARRLLLTPDWSRRRGLVSVNGRASTCSRQPFWRRSSRPKSTRYKRPRRCLPSLSTAAMDPLIAW